VTFELLAMDKFIGRAFRDPGNPPIVAYRPGRLDMGFQRLGIDSLLNGQG